MPCAIPPLDQSTVEVGRGYGLGYNRDRSRRDQLHGGMDLVASSGTPVLAPIAGVVDFVSRNDGPRINADSARAGSVGQVRRMGGYGNAVVLRHDMAVPGLPTPFYTSYNHLSALAPGIAPGAAVASGTLLGQVGNTTNDQFAGMGSHLHVELRRVPFPGSYERDTMDPSVLFSALGIDWLDSRREVGRGVGGRLLIRAGGPADPAVCGGVRGLGRGTGLEGLDDYLAELGYVAPTGYVDPARIASKYTRYGSTQAPRPGSPAADVMPPDYAAVVDGSSSGGSSGGSGLVIGVAAAIVIAGMMKR